MITSYASMFSFFYCGFTSFRLANVIQINESGIHNMNINYFCEFKNDYVEIFLVKLLQKSKDRDTGP